MDRAQLERAVRARMTEHGEDYATARRTVLAEAGQPGGEQRTATPPGPDQRIPQTRFRPPPGRDQLAAAGRDVEIDETAVAAMFRDPEGPLRGVMERCGGIVALGAKRRAEKRTGKMAGEITTRGPSADERGLFIDVISPAQAAKTGFPYPTVHEGRHVRDRRAHRSLKPALNDLKKLGFVK